MRTSDYVVRMGLSTGILLSVLVFVMVCCVGVIQTQLQVDFSDPIFSKLDEEGKNIIREYAQAYPKIKIFYENIKMDASVRSEYFPSEEELETMKLDMQSLGLDEDKIQGAIEKFKQQSDLQYEVRYRQLDGYVRVDTKASHEVNIIVFTPTTEYQLSKNDPRSEYFSLNTRRDRNDRDTEGIGMAVLYFDTAPFFFTIFYAA